MKKLMLFGALFVAIAGVSAAGLVASTTDAVAAVECKAEIVKGRAAHWSYRLIDGRKCWYEGKTQIPKSELHWGQRTEAAVRENPVATNAQASPPPPEAVAEESVDPEDGSCCWPPKKEGDSFESRWQSLGLRPSQ